MHPPQINITVNRSSAREVTHGLRLDSGWRNCSERSAGAAMRWRPPALWQGSLRHRDAVPQVSSIAPFESVGAGALTTWTEARHQPLASTGQTIANRSEGSLDPRQRRHEPITAASETPRSPRSQGCLELLLLEWTPQPSPRAARGSPGSRMQPLLQRLPPHPQPAVAGRQPPTPPPPRQPRRGMRCSPSPRCRSGSPGR